MQTLSRKKVDPIKRFEKFTTPMTISHIPCKGIISNLATPIAGTSKTCKIKPLEETLLYHDLHVQMRELRQHKTNGFAHVNYYGYGRHRLIQSRLDMYRCFSSQ